jgi:hypothetical protein
MSTSTATMPNSPMASQTVPNSMSNTPTATTPATSIVATSMPPRSPTDPGPPTTSAGPETTVQTISAGGVTSESPLTTASNADSDWALPAGVGVGAFVLLLLIFAAILLLLRRRKGRKSSDAVPVPAGAAMSQSQYANIIVRKPEYDVGQVEGSARATTTTTMALMSTRRGI